MLRINELKLPLDHPDHALRDAILTRLGIEAIDLVDFTVYKRSYDARKKAAIVLIYAIDVEVKNEAAVLKRLQGDQYIVPSPDTGYKFVDAPRPPAGTPRPIVVGTGPCGLFVALILAERSADLPRIQRQVERIAQGIVHEDPKKWAKTRFWADSKLDLFARMTVGRTDTFDSGAGLLLALVAAAMLIFMLLPALNLVNLNTGRIMERRVEIGVRKAFGATSAQLAIQLVVENVLLCLAGGLIALAATAGVLAWLEHIQLIDYMRYDLNLAVFGWGMLIATIFGLLSGVLPAWKMSRLDPVHALKGAV
ncbi:MAG TPA: hypothetical protein DDX04_11680 [Massilia sp.]|nr:hypothetical protein [Massilia sp.]